MKKDNARPKEVEACKRWLKSLRANKMKTILRSSDEYDYWLKHRVEDWLRNIGPEHGMYISECSFNQAKKELQ
jgi:hypothetical protein